MVSALALGLIAAQVMGPDQAYRRTVATDDGTKVVCVAWGTRTVTYRVDEAGSARTPGESEFTAIDAAFATWQVLSGTCSDFNFVRGPRIANPTVGRSGEDANVLTFREASCHDAAPEADPCQADGSCGNAWRCWDHSEATIALTTLTFSRKTGLIVDADIEFNAAGYLFTTISGPPCAPGAESPSCAAYDLQNTATHEIGHVVGLDHVDVSGSTMEPTAPLGEVDKRVIDPGTAEGFCGIYPAGSAPVPCDDADQLQRRLMAENVGTFGCACSDATGAPMLLALALLGLARRKQRA